VSEKALRPNDAKLISTDE